MSVNIADPSPSTSPGLPLTASEAEPSQVEQQTPHLVLKPTKGWVNLNLREMWMFRDLLMSLASRDIKLRYKQTVLGAIWVVLQPLIAAAIFAVVFSTIGNITTEGVPPFLFNFVSLIWWTAFSVTLSKVSGVLLANSQLVSKVYFPRLILPISVVFSTLVDVAVSLGVLFVMLLLYKVAPGWPILTFPIWLALGLIFATGFGLNAAALMVYYRDVGYVLPVLIQFLTYASPVAYPLSQVAIKGSDKLAFIFNLNPLTGLLEAFRWSFFSTIPTNTPPAWGALLYSIAATVFFAITGAYQFRRLEKRFADVI